MTRSLSEISESDVDITIEFDLIEEPGTCSRCRRESDLLVLTTSICICDPEYGLTESQRVRLQRWAIAQHSQVCWLSSPNCQSSPVVGQSRPMPMCSNQRVCVDCLMWAEENIEKNVAKAFGKETP